jgi:hypothetical protein
MNSSKSTLVLLVLACVFWFKTYVKETNLFCLFLFVKYRKRYRQDEDKKLSSKGVAVNQWVGRLNVGV